MSEAWVCRNCGEQNLDGCTVCTRCGEVSDLPPNLPNGNLLTKSRALDTTLGAFGTLFLCAIPIVGGLLYTNSTNRVWALFAGFAAALALGLAAIFLLRKTHRALMVGAIIGLCVAILNPASLCLGILGFAGLAGN